MFRRSLTVVAAVVTVMALAAAPALAGSMYLSKSSGRAAQAFWTQVDDVPVGTNPVVGNVHIGELYVYETSNGVADAFAYIADFDCEPGQLPDHGGHGFEENPGCTHVGFRYGDGYGLRFEMDRKLNVAHVSGRLTIYGGHGGDVVGSPPVDVTWTGVGDRVTQRSTWRYSDGTTSYTDRYRSSDRAAAMSGTIGPMGFDPDLSGGYMSIFKSMSKGRTR